MNQVHGVARRETKYTLAVRAVAQRSGHVTNAKLAEELRIKFPYVSDTTVHRVSQRLCEDGELQLAPKAMDGSVRYDANSQPHDHFACGCCDSLRDIQVPLACRALIQHQLGGCLVSGPLTITGICQRCRE